MKTTVRPKSVTLSEVSAAAGLTTDATVSLERMIRLSFPAAPVPPFTLPPTLRLPAGSKINRSLVVSVPTRISKDSNLSPATSPEFRPETVHSTVAVALPVSISIGPLNPVTVSSALLPTNSSMRSNAATSVATGAAPLRSRDTAVPRPAKLIESTGGTGSSAMSSPPSINPLIDPPGAIWNKSAARPPMRFSMLVNPRDPTSGRDNVPESAPVTSQVLSGSGTWGSPDSGFGFGFEATIASLPGPPSIPPSRLAPLWSRKRSVAEPPTSLLMPENVTSSSSKPRLPCPRPVMIQSVSRSGPTRVMRTPGFPMIVRMSAWPATSSATEPVTVTSPVGPLTVIVMPATGLVAVAVLRSSVRLGLVPVTR